MRPFRFCALVLLAALPLAVGCSSNNEGKIEGTRWTCTSANMRGTNVPGIAGKLKLNFRADGKVSYVTPEGTFNGSYTLGMGDYVTLDFDRPLGGLTQHVQQVEVNGDEMTMTDSDGTYAVFRRLGRSPTSKTVP